MVSERLDAFVRRAFPEADAEAVIDRLEALNLANAERQSHERIQAAIVLLSAGDRQRFADNVRLAEKDWRDVLVFSGLGDGDWERRLDAELAREGGAMPNEGCVVALEPGAGATLVNPVGGHVTFKARGHETGGTLTVLETVVTPGDGPPLHVHLKDDEAIYVLDGEIDFRVGDDVYHNRVGSFVFVPRGTPHTFQNVGSGDARMLLAFTPAGIERLFEGAAAAGVTSAEEEAWARAAQEAETEMVGPPLRRSGTES